jgi:hypothetical protein
MPEWILFSPPPPAGKEHLAFQTLFEIAIKLSKLQPHLRKLYSGIIKLQVLFENFYSVNWSDTIKMQRANTPNVIKSKRNKMVCYAEIRQGI